jgi:N6-adenosine-specific RNA methylase IME4
MNLIIDDYFKSIIPPLKPDEYNQLEKNIINAGRVYETIKTWNDIIIDGHNRYEIATRHNIKFETKALMLNSRDDAIVWIVDNQAGRRNLDDWAIYNLQDTKREALARIGKENIISGQKLRRNKEDLTLPLSGKVTESHDTQNIVAGALGWSHSKVAKFDVVKKKAPPEIIKKIVDREITPNQAYTEIKQIEKKVELENKKIEYENKVELFKEKTNDFKIDIFNTDKKFRIIYADPPWKYDLEQTSPNLGGAIKHYNSMSIDELCKIPVDKISDKDSVLFLWVTSPKLNLFLQLMISWGYDYKTSFVWDKIKHNMGHYNSVRHEFLLIGGKGKSAPDIKELFDSVQSIERSDKHSEKPIEFMNIIDTLYTHGERIELFCRDQKKENWFFWGNEC